MVVDSPKEKFAADYHKAQHRLSFLVDDEVAEQTEWALVNIQKPVLKIEHH